MLNLKKRIRETLETMTSYYFKGGEFEDQDLYCEDIADKCLSEFIKEIEDFEEKVEKIMGDTLSADTLKYHNEVNEMYRKLATLKKELINQYAKKTKN